MQTIFLIAPHFPPSAMPPSQRVRLYVQHMKGLGFYPVVFTVDHYYREEIADPWMNELAGNDFEVVKVKCFDQRKTRRFGLGDQGLRMLPFLYHILVKEAKSRQPAFILYPVPPWYIMLVAPFVKKATNIKFGIDFIDPWVHNAAKTGMKARLSQWVARKTEPAVLKNADLIVAVSQTILDDIQARYPLPLTPILALPYGVEPSDFKHKVPDSAVKCKAVRIQYIGALSNAMLPVAKVMVSALHLVSSTYKISVSFVGTSYAPQGVAVPKLTQFLKAAGVSSFTREHPDRVGYKDAISLTLQSDILLLIGDTTHYYAASKLMGLVASGKLFVAFIHEKSFPAVFLADQGYPYYVTYGDNLEEIREKKHELAEMLNKAISERDHFMPLNTADASFEEHTAFGMTKKLTDKINSVIHAG